MLVAVFFTEPEVGQFLIGVLLAVVGYILHRKANKIHILVNSRMHEALAEIERLKAKVERLEKFIAREKGGF